MNRGKLVILLMLGVAVCAAAFAAWYQYRGQNRAHDFWGTSSAVLISEAPHVEVFLLGESQPAGEDDSDNTASSDEDSQEPKTFEYGDRAWPVASVKDGSSAQGIQNIRKALVQNTTFDWRTPPGDDEPEWQYALAFTDKRRWATVLFDFQANRVALTGGRKTALLDPAASKDLREFFAEQFSDQPSGEMPAENPPEQPSASPAEKPADETPEAKSEEK